MAKNQNKFFLGNLDATGQYTGYRLAFKPNIAEARAFNEGDTPKFDVTLLIPKTDKAGLKRLRDAVDAAIDATDWSAKAKQQVKKVAWDTDAFNDNSVIKDGDAKNERAAEEGASTYEQRAGHYTVKLTRKESFGPVGCFNADAVKIPEIEKAGAFQAGYWVNVSAQVYCYDFNGKKGVSLQFDAVQLIREDDIFGMDNPFSAVEVPDATKFDDALEFGDEE